MTRHIIILAMLTTIAGWPLLAKATGETPSNDATTCTSGSDERILAIAVVNEGCELTYTKGGESKSVANQKSGLSICEKVKGQIEKKLKASGYTCK